MKNGRRLLSMLLLVAMLVPMLPVTALTAWADTVKNTATDAMEEIEADSTLAAYRKGETQSYADDGYIGIPYEVSVYYDSATHGKAKAGYMTNGATPVIMYVVNTNVERIGRELLMEKQKKTAMATNIDFYSGFVYDMLGLPQELYTPLFAVARMSGWAAHRMEELTSGGKLIRPRYECVEAHRAYTSMEDR